MNMSSSIIRNNLYSYMDESVIHELLKCRICTKPFVNPVVTENGDRFCRTCIVSILSRRSLNRNISDEDDSSSNDSDQQSSKLQKLTPVTDEIVLAMLNGLPVRCTKCGLINIKRGLLEEHENTSCTQATVQCDAVDIKCTWMGARDELDEHLEECKFEPLRSALGFLFAENAQLKSRLEKLETEVTELMTVKGMENFNFDS